MLYILEAPGTLITVMLSKMLKYLLWRVGRGVRQRSAKPCTRVRISYAPPRASGGIGIRDGLKIRWLNKPCGFKSHLAHQNNRLISRVCLIVVARQSQYTVVVYVWPLL